MFSISFLNWFFPHVDSGDLTYNSENNYRRNCVVIQFCAYMHIPLCENMYNCVAMYVCVSVVMSLYMYINFSMSLSHCVIICIHVFLAGCICLRIPIYVCLCISFSKFSFFISLGFICISLCICHCVYLCVVAQVSEYV